MSEQQPNGNGRHHRPTFDNRISLGNIISASLILVAIIAAYYENKGDILANAKDIVSLDRRVAQDLKTLDRRVMKVENRVDLGERPASGRPR